MVDNNFPGVPGIQGGSIGKPQGNPLAKHLRQPRIYIKLPSGGKYWPKNSLDMPENGELPVYAMTARDEILFKTPDALLNGQATVDVIQSCFPNIKNAWDTPSIDLDTILIALRMATFGESIEMGFKIPGTDIHKDFNFNLQNLYDKYQSVVFEDTFQIDGFAVQIKPVTYRVATQQSIKAFEEQRIFNIVNDDSYDDATKLKRFQESFKKLTDLNVSTLIDSVVAIQPDDSDTAVTEPKYIKEFLEGCEARTFNQIQEHIKVQKEKFNLQPVEVEADEEEIKAGAPAKYSVPITFDQSNFFGSGS